MEALGRLFNVVPSVGGASGANGKALSLVGAQAATFILNGADTYTFTCSATFAGSYTSIGNIIVKRYALSAVDGTVAWTQPANQAASNAVVVASGAVAVHISGSALPDTMKYIKCTVTSTTGLVTAILHDLYVQRTPPNLAIVGA